jgi:hypothetical protein
LALDSAGRLALTGFSVELSGLVPLVNGEIPTQGSWQETSRSTEAGTFTWTLGAEGEFQLDWQRVGERLALRYSLEKFPLDQPLLRFGLRLARLSGHRAFLRNGYFSWDGSYFLRSNEEAAAKRVIGYAMTQLLPTRADDASVLLGFDRHETFQQFFTFEPGAAALSLETAWDDKARAPGEKCSSERLWVFSAPDVEEGLRSWARILAEGSSRPPRLQAPQIRGWCSWYNLYAAISETVIFEQLRGVQTVAARERLPMEIFQIDDGFTPEMGDWLETKPQFPRGMKPVLDKIRAAGFKPGLWIAPFMVGNRSGLFRDHPDWVVQERATGRPLAHMKFYGEFRWHKRSEEYYILDTTHPDALAYLREVFGVWRQEWGCEYFKTDFMHFGSEYGPDKARWHQSGLTRIEIWRRTAAVIREAIGDAVWLGCGCPLWASVGLVDGVRIGRDIGVEWKGNYSAESLLRDQATRNFAHRILWQADPDCILLRERFHFLMEREIRSLALYAGMSGGVTMTSDALDELSPARVALWRQVLAFGSTPCRFPLLGQRTEAGEPDAVLVQVRENPAGETLVLVFNPSDDFQSRHYALSRLGLDGAWRGRIEVEESNAPWAPLTELSLTLPPHESVLFRLQRQNDLN